uniref:sodium:solute symporter family transporter n=1 Tax=Cephaloticoccus sp. TaxID=1985742 RepID=UPI00404AAA53
MALIGIGIYYSRRQTTTEDYFVGGRSISPFLAGISLYATLFSTLSYIGVPGEIIQNGPVLVGIGVAAAPLIYLIVGYWIIPMIMKLPVTSAYELLEKRLGFPVRLLGSTIFVATRLLWMAVMLYTTSFVLVSVMGWDPTMSTPLAIFAGGLTAIYTVTGGLRAVVVSDVVQFFVLLIGAVFTLIFITVTMGGIGAWWPTEGVTHWQPQPFFSFDPDVRVTVVGTFIGAIIWWLCTSASDQMAIQRYLSTRDEKAARRAFLHNTIGNIVVTLVLGLVGLAVLGFYRSNPGAIPSTLSLSGKGDVFFPHYVSHFLPAGVPGLVLAGLLAAAMSSLSSGINSTITVISTDFIEPFRKGPARSNASQLKTARYLAAAISVVAIAGSQVAGAIPGNLIEVASKTVNLLICPLFGLFFLALFVKSATPFGALMGAIYSFSAALLIGYWDLLIGGDSVSFQWIAPISLAVTMVCGPLFSQLPTRGKSKAVMAAYYATGIAPIVAFVVIAR